MSAPFTPPQSWTTIVDGAAWARQLAQHINRDSRLIEEGGVYLVPWCTAMILAGQKHTTDPRRFDPDDRDTWPEIDESVLVCYGTSGWDVLSLYEANEPMGLVWLQRDGTACPARYASLWLPLPPTPEADGRRWAEAVINEHAADGHDCVDCQRASAILGVSSGADAPTREGA